MPQRNWLRRLIEMTPLIAAGGVILAATLTFRSSTDSVKAQYVSLAVSILRDPQKPENGGSNIDLRAWAVKILEKNSPVPMSAKVAGDLGSGQITFPNVPSISGTQGGGANQPTNIPSVSDTLGAGADQFKEQIMAMLERAADHPTRWHDIGKLPQTLKAAELLEKSGLIEICQPQNQYRLKPGTK